MASKAEEEKGNSRGKGVRTVRMGLVFLGMASVAWLLLCTYSNSSSYSNVLFQVFATNTSFGQGIDEILLEMVLRNASMEDKTVILTTLNEAWAKPNSIFDLFLESFHIGNNTKRLLNHLVVICLDEKAFNRCLALHPHCYLLRTKGINFSNDAFFKTPIYLDMMWRRIEFMIAVLEEGYNFLFTDTDIMWLRDPFPHFFPDADFQIASDLFSGNSYDVNNKANGGFSYVKSSNKTITFYKFLYYSRKMYPGNHDQDVFNKIKHDKFFKKIGLQPRFLDTAHFGGFCEPSRDLNLVCTMHANCCIGLENKVHDLQILLHDWRRYLSMNPSMQPHASWSVPQDCSPRFCKD
ncbi:uncharacterized protein At4g15970-like isoform X2 [Ziziphus jujuba]|uniref:Uncharacterized protein At4g15970-like isoform X2 n=1 Tax=Ziziphus jujuba TaxID=326968 RepID=A0A6P3ZV67_ZIZJJ|nr:uncharacterized protein At4g15970-like isoform X2 [Ziziphus jujuba]